MTGGEYVELLTSGVKKYYADGVIESIKRNSHMNNYSGEEIEDETIKAILVDFVNDLCAKQCIDLAMYTLDLDSKNKTEDIK